MQFTQLLDELIRNRVKCTLSNDPEISYFLTDYDKDFKVITMETGEDNIPCFLSISAVVGFIVQKQDDNIESVFISIINEDIISRAVKGK